MDQYTEVLTRMSDTLSPDDDQYEEKLLAISSSFRSFSQALTSFICENGYTGDVNSVEEKAKYLKLKYKEAGISPHRDIRKWFSENRKFKADAAYQICFAFNLGVDGTRDFFRRVYFERAFDCRSISEAVYYYCMRNGLTYTDAIAIIAKMPENKSTANIRYDREILYTGTIMEFINGVKSADELVEYINEHIEHFGYTNATATKHIQELWVALACNNGLAYQEGLLLDKAFNFDLGKDFAKEDKYTVVSKEADSVWGILAQIIGLDRQSTTEFGTGRTIKPLLEDNDLLPTLAVDCFPDRDGIEKILNGVHVSHERIRKVLILLEFYTYWASETVKHNNALWEATEIDAERCVDKINRYLIEAGYPELYPGNPYDWIFMWAVKDPWPLATFRDYMISLYAYKRSALAEE